MKTQYRKILLAILSIVIICVALAGCVDKKEEEQPEESPDKNVTVEVDKTELIDITDFITKVTKSESFTYEVKGTIYGTDGDMIIKYDKSKIYGKIASDTDGTDEYIVAGVGKSIYEYFKDGDTWYYYVYDNVESIETRVSDYKQEIANILKVDNYVYSIDKKAFVLKDGVDVSDAFGGVELTDISMVLKGDTVTMIASGEGTNITITIKDINTTEVTLPINATERLMN